MTNVKSFLSVILAAIMLTTMMAGCSSSAQRCLPLACQKAPFVKKPVYRVDSLITSSVLSSMCRSDSCGLAIFSTRIEHACCPI